jgi:hypothetical protein
MGALPQIVGLKMFAACIFRRIVPALFLAVGVAGQGPRFAGIVHHTAAERDYAYDRESKVGKLDKVLDEASAKGWTVVDMMQDWKAVFPSDR